jgi:hypothetical protein
VAFDHLMVLVADEAAAAREFEDAGFTVTPRSELPGMANRLICFPSSVACAASFIELLSVEQPDAVPAAVRDLIGQTPGPIALVFAVPDLNACLRTFSQSGVAVAGPLEIRRRWTLPSGQTLDVALDVAIGEEGALPFRWVMVQHHTVAHYLRSDFTAHANGCGAIRAVVMSGDEPLLVAERMRQVFGSVYERIGASAVVDLQNAHLLLLPRSADLHRGAEVGVDISGVILERGSAAADFGDLVRRFSEGVFAGSIRSISPGRLKLFQPATP